MSKESPFSGPKIWQPLGLALAVCIGLFFGVKLSGELPGTRTQRPAFTSDSGEPLIQVWELIQARYVDEVNDSLLRAEGISALLSALDPHSDYQPPQLLQANTENLEGNFEGIGIEFYLLQDTILVVTAIPGGPSEAVGLRAGDKIIRIDGEEVAGKELGNQGVVKRLRGAKGTRVKVEVLRKGQPGLKTFTITRDQIPIHSLDASFMLDAHTGYIKLNRFSATSGQELRLALDKLNRLGMQKLILDLRGNPGGYLHTAVEVADEFLGKGLAVVSTQGRTQARREYKSTAKGGFERGQLAVLVDEGSASASEIVAGAVQDWDRGTVWGVRTFGKGLVQEEFVLADGSAIRLTVSRYYTPSGRSIQRPYSQGRDKYEEEWVRRIMDGDPLEGDSAGIPDSLIFKTSKGRLVYGGGGIFPDRIVHRSNDHNSELWIKAASSGVLVDFAHRYVQEKEVPLKAFGSARAFAQEFIWDEGSKQQLFQEIKKTVSGANWSDEAGKKIILRQTQALIARRLFGDEGFYRVLLKDDPVPGAVLEDWNQSI